MWLGRFICCSRVILSLAACWLQHHELVQLTTTIIAYLQQIPLVLTFPNGVKKSSCLEETNKEILGAPKEFWFCKRFKNENLMRTERIERKPWSDISNSCKEKPIGCIFMTFNMLLARNQIPCTKVLKSQLHHNKFMAKLLEFNLISELFISMFSRYFNVLFLIATSHSHSTLLYLCFNYIFFGNSKAIILQIIFELKRWSSRKYCMYKILYRVWW